MGNIFTAGFRVLIKKGKEFMPVSNLVFPRKEALKLGQSKAKDGTFRIAPGFGNLGKTRGLGKFRQKQFYKKGRTFVAREQQQKLRLLTSVIEKKTI